MLGVDLRATRIEDGGFDRPIQELVRMATEELIKGILAGHVYGQPAAAAASPAPHLLEARDRSGKRDADGGIQLADVDSELERISGHDPEQGSLGQPTLDALALGRRVAGPIWGDAVRKCGVEPVG